MITELKVGRGGVEVKSAGAHEWRLAGPLLALRAGDQVRATEDASVVILLSGGRGSVKVVAAGSPFVVTAPQLGESKAQKAMMLLEASVSFLSTTVREALHAPLSTRDGSNPPVILTPRNGPVLPDSLTFEWVGNRSSRYTIRIMNPDCEPRGVVFEKRGLTEAKFDYPPDARPLAPGTRYKFQVVSKSDPPQETWFELLDFTRSQAIRQDLKEMEEAIGPTVSPNTLVTLRAAFLANNGLLYNARLLLVDAMAKDPDEPTLHFLLGSVYRRMELPEQAAESYSTAAFLVSGRAKR